PQQNSCNGDSLFLSSTQPHTSLTYSCLISVVKFHNEVMCVSKFSSADQFVLRIPIHSIRNVLFYSSIKELCFLCYNPNVIPIRCCVQLSKILSIDKYPPCLWIIESHH